MHIKRLAVRAAAVVMALAAAVASANPLLQDAEDWTRALPGLELMDPASETPPGLSFESASGEPRLLSGTRGRLRLVNLWATWCAPCREEMPALDRLAGRFEGGQLQVIAIASGPNSIDDINRFYESAGLQTLAIYRNPDSQIAARLGAIALPSSFLIGPDGRMLARLVGDADWDAPAVIELIRDQIADK